MKIAPNRKKRHSSVLYQYIMSHFGLVIFFCALIGILLLNFFSAEFNRQILDTRKQTGDAVLRDLESQIQLMNKISSNISSNIHFSASELQSNNYNEYAMLKEYSYYASSNILTQKCFLLFQEGNVKIYFSDSSSTGKGATYTWNLFHEYLLEAADPDGLLETLLTVKRQTILPVNDHGMFLFLFPLRIESGSVNTICGFCVTENQLLERARLVSGETGSFDIRTSAGIVLIQDRASHSPKAAKVTCVSENKQFILEKYVEISSELQIVLKNQPILLYGLGLCLLMLIVAAVVAYRHFKPIENINELIGSKENAPEQKKRRNELMNIESQLRNMLHQEDERQLQMNRQIGLLREQTLHLLLCGEYYEEMEDVLRKLNISTDECKMGIAVIQLAGQIGEAEKGFLIQKIEELSTAQIRFFGCMDKNENMVDVLFTTDEADSFYAFDAVELLQNLLEAETIPASIGCGCLYDDVHSLPASYAEAQDDLLGKSMTTAVVSQQEDREYFKKILGYVRLREADQAVMALDQYARKSERESNSLMWLRCMFVDLLHLLVDLAHEMNVDIYPNQISVVLTAQSLPALHRGLKNLILFICDRGGSKEGEENQEETQVEKIADYIREHYCENDLSLEKIAAEFNITSGYLSRLIRTSTGVGYKDYVLRLRMDLARQCLREGMSTTETCHRCGYANVSHFIKTFKQFCGVTPSVYQKEEGVSLIE